MLVYLRVPYADKDVVKGMGAEWDNKWRMWHTPWKKDPRPFREWMAPDVALTIDKYWERHRAPDYERRAVFSSSKKLEMTNA